MVYVLEEIFKSKKNENSEQFNLRIQRALSWLRKAAYIQDDLDLQFLSLWISFNAMHAQDLDAAEQCHQRTSSQFHVFLERLYPQDHSQKISHLVWNKMPQQIQWLLDHPYAFQDYWNYKNQKISQLTWKANFAVEQQRVLQAFQTKDTQRIIITVFERLLTLRNQILLGGTSYNSAMNRQQLKDSCYILLMLLPVFLEVLIENAQHLDFTKPFYPIMHMS